MRQIFLILLTLGFKYITVSTSLIDIKETKIYPKYPFKYKNNLPTFIHLDNKNVNETIKSELDNFILKSFNSLHDTQNVEITYLEHKLVTEHLLFNTNFYKHNIIETIYYNNIIGGVSICRYDTPNFLKVTTINGNNSINVLTTLVQNIIDDFEKNQKQFVSTNEDPKISIKVHNKNKNLILVLTTNNFIIVHAKKDLLHFQYMFKG